MAKEPYAGYPKIIHIDMDAFYASVEIRDNPSLAQRPMVVGGEARGVVLTANYEARRYGIHSAMPCFMARERCPALVFVKPRYEAYKEASQAMREIFLRYTDILEPLSLDEAFLDVSQHPSYASVIAKEIRHLIHKEIGITASAGVSCNKLVAKIASDFRKPNGLTVVAPDQVPAFMEPLPLRKIPGIGPVSDGRLKEQGFHTCQDIWNLGEQAAIDRFGSRFGAWLWRVSHGQGSSKVGEKRQRKSVGLQRSFPPKAYQVAELENRLTEMAETISRRLAKNQLVARTLTVKVKRANFKTSSRSLTSKADIYSSAKISAMAHRVFTVGGRLAWVSKSASESF